MAIYAPSGEKFATYLELAEQRHAAQQQATEAQQQAVEARREADQARETAAKLAAQLKSLGVDPEL